MIKIKIEGLEDLEEFINLLGSIDEDRVRQLIEDLDDSTNKLLCAIEIVEQNLEGEKK